MHPTLAKLNDLYQSGQITDSHVLMQEIELFTDLFGEISTDPLHGITNFHKHYPAATLFQECLQESTNGRSAYNVYMGRHNEYLGSSPYVQNEDSPVLPSPANVNHAGLSVSSWYKKAIVPLLMG